MEISEFSDAYSDDQIYLEMIERLVNEHPVEANVPERIKYSSFSRLWIVMMVGSIESMISELSQTNTIKDIGLYFKKGVDNTQRIEYLARALEREELKPDKEILSDYLAIKHIRNSYVHGSWTKEGKKCVQERGLPRSCTEFSKAHFERFKECFYHMLKCLSFAKIQNSNKT